MFFKPKDKVSGDFYWWANVDNKTIITAVDCTGHGVPGAFMSMLGASLLREIVQKEKISNTSEILDRLRQEIIKALKQNSEIGSQKDGMDMSIISIDRDTNIIEFSGANNHIYIVSKSDLQLLKGNEKDLKLFKKTEIDTPEQKMLYELKPDKMPIAHFPKMNSFTSLKLQLQKDDKLYLFSDGFADQFGGVKGKKFRYKPFKELILENSNKQMEVQKEILENSFANWKGKNEQIDDVVVLGLKI